jgi:hypothetical protein
VNLVPGGAGIPRDLDGDGRIDFADVTWLFTRL